MLRYSTDMRTENDKTGIQVKVPAATIGTGGRFAGFSGFACTSSEDRCLTERRGATHDSAAPSAQFGPPPNLALHNAQASLALAAMIAFERVPFAGSSSPSTRALMALRRARAAVRASSSRSPISISSIRL